MLEACRWLEATAVGTMVRESLYGFPILVAIHILGIVLSVGLFLWFDLRLLGLALRMLPVRRVYRRLRPWVSVGFCTMFVSGALLFTGYASSAYGNTFFRVKAASMFLAGVNALWYHWQTERSIAAWDDAGIPPPAARLAGAASLLLWAAVIFSGRMMAYTMY